MFSNTHIFLGCTRRSDRLNLKHEKKEEETEIEEGEEREVEEEEKEKNRRGEAYLEENSQEEN